MGRFKSTNIEFEGRVQVIEELISRARFYAQTNRAYSLEIIIHLQDHAHQYNDSVLFDVCRELMMNVQSPSPYTTSYSKQKPADFNNLPATHECTWEEKKQCFKNAVLYVMTLEKKTGGYLFHNNTHWIAIYRFAVVIRIMYEVDSSYSPKEQAKPQYNKFSEFAKELSLDVSPPTRLPFKLSAINSLSKNNYIKYLDSPPWLTKDLKGKSLKLCKEMNAIYGALQKKYNDLVQQTILTNKS